MRIREREVDAMISVEHVSKRYGPVVAVDDASFGIDRGEVVGFLGQNGAGKTTAMRMLAGTLQPDEGEVLFDGRPIGDDLVGARRRVGYLPERNPLYDQMLVAEYLEYAAELRDLEGSARREALDDAVGATAIDDVYYRPVSELSKGYRQRVGLAAAILHRPEILILDEPTEGLDPNQRVGIRRLVNELGRDRTVLLSTHVLAEVEATCDRVLIIHRGSIVADGGVDELLEARKGAARYRVEAAGDEVAGALGELDGVASVREEEVEDGRTRVVVRAVDDRELRPTIFETATRPGWQLWELYRERGSLEDVFQALTEDTGEEAAGAEDGFTGTGRTS